MTSGEFKRINLVVIYLALSLSHKMSDETRYSQPSSSTSTGARGRGYSSRRRIGKHIRARGRGYRGGLPARYQERLTPDGEQSEQLEEAEAAELEARYARRTIGTNADRYEEPEPEIGLDGMNSIELHIINIMRCKLIDRTTNRRTRGGS
jgi:hypothetical protein